MKNAIITEFVKFKGLENRSDEQIITASENFINDFHVKQDGFIDVELIKPFEGNDWMLIFHFENMEKVKAIGEKMRSSKEFGEFATAIVPGSISVSFNHKLKGW